MPEQQADAADGNVQDFARPSRIFEGAALAGHLAAAGVPHPGPTLSTAGAFTMESCQRVNVSSMPPPDCSASPTIDRTEH